MRGTPLISLIGRPNVGKSSIFNRLLGNFSKAIIHDTPGVTRDRNYSLMTLEELGEEKGSLEIVLVDTGGLYSAKYEDFEIFTEDSDLLCLVIDGNVGITPQDMEIYNYIRKTSKPFWVLFNKVDDDLKEQENTDFYSLGISEENIFLISAIHGRGINTLKKAMQKYVQENNFNEQTVLLSEGLCSNLAIIGAPNCGKSTLLNKLTMSNRSLVSPTPGTTTDPVEAYINVPSKGMVKIVDTAGIRRKRALKDEELEGLTVQRALKVMALSDIVLLMVDVTIGLTHHDKRLCDLAIQRGKSLIVVFNKVDLLEEVKKNGLRGFNKWFEEKKQKIPWKHIEVLPLSAKNGKFIKGLLGCIKKTISVREKKITTSDLNRCIHKLVINNSIIVRRKGKAYPLKIKYATVKKMSPPTVLLYSNCTMDIPKNYRKYLENGLRQTFSLVNTPVHLIFKNS